MLGPWNPEGPGHCDYQGAQSGFALAPRHCSPVRQVGRVLDPACRVESGEPWVCPFKSRDSTTFKGLHREEDVVAYGNVGMCTTNCSWLICKETG